MNKKIVNFVWIVSALFVLDQLTKILIEKLRPSGSGFFSINYTTNTGAAFGMLKGGNVFIIVLSFIVLAAIIYFIFYYSKKTSKNIAIFSALLFAGTLGNLIDRLFRGYVIDFIDFGFWPAFNIADIAITAGVLGLIYYIYKS